MCGYATHHYLGAKVAAPLADTVLYLAERRECVRLMGDSWLPRPPKHGRPAPLTLLTTYPGEQNAPALFLDFFTYQSPLELIPSRFIDADKNSAIDLSTLAALVAFTKPLKSHQLAQRQEISRGAGAVVIAPWIR